MPVAALLKPHVRDLGDGFTVRRVLPSFPRQAVGPFVFFDHMGPVALPPGEGLDVRPHPHIGLATVTWLFEGAIVHRDNLGFVQRIAPGDVNWMTAGRGIAHSERSDPADRRAGVRLHGLQTWVALPRAHEEAEPAFVHVPAGSLPVLTPEGAHLTVVAGHAFGASAASVPVFSATLYVAGRLAPDATIALPDEHEERAVYLVDGDAEVDGVPLPPGAMAILERGTAQLRARSEARFMLVGGDALDAPRHLWWNFVSSSKDRIEQAKSDWKAQRFAPIPGESEFIPLPEH